MKQIVVKGTKVIPLRGTGTFAWPTVGGYYVSSKMGQAGVPCIKVQTYLHIELYKNGQLKNFLDYVN